MSTPLMILGAFFALGAVLSLAGTWVMSEQHRHPLAKVATMALLTLALAYLAFRCFGGTL